MLREIMSMAVYNLSHRKTRSFLTLLGIVIGVSAVVGTMLIGSSLEQRVTIQLNKFTADVITIIPGKISFAGGGLGSSGEATILTTRDESEVSKVDGIGLASGMISGQLRVGSNNESGKITVYGVQDAKAWEQIQADNIGLEDGQFLTDSDKYSVKSH